jgi:hypothetical protein
MLHSRHSAAALTGARQQGAPAPPARLPPVHVAAPDRPATSQPSRHILDRANPAAEHTDDVGQSSILEQAATSVCPAGSFNHWRQLWRRRHSRHELQHSELLSTASLRAGVAAQPPVNAGAATSSREAALQAATGTTTGAGAPPRHVLLDPRTRSQLSLHSGLTSSPLQRKPRLPAKLSPQHLQVLQDIRGRRLLHKGETLLLAVSGSQVCTTLLSGPCYFSRSCPVS